MKFKKLWLVSVLAVAVLFGVLCLMATNEVSAAETQYKITFRGNGGKTSQNQDRYTQQFTPGKPITLAPNYFNRSGYKFVGWGLLSSSTNPTYQPNQPISSAPWKMNIELHAIWSVDKAQYKIVYTNTDGKTYTQIAYVGEKVTLQGNIFSRSGYTLLGWSTTKGKFIKGSSDYALNAKINALASKNGAVVGLYPIWKAQYKIVYNGNGGWRDPYNTGARDTSSYSVVETTGVKITANKFQYNDGLSLYTMVGWGNDPKNPTKIIKPDFVGDIAAEFGITSPSKTKEINVYAVWVQKDTPYKIASKPLSKGDPTIWVSTDGKTVVMYLSPSEVVDFTRHAFNAYAHSGGRLKEAASAIAKGVEKGTPIAIKTLCSYLGYSGVGTAAAAAASYAISLHSRYKDCDKIITNVRDALLVDNGIDCDCTNGNVTGVKAIRIILYTEKTSFVSYLNPVVAKPFVIIQPYSGVLRTGAAWASGSWATLSESGMQQILNKLK